MIRYILDTKNFSLKLDSSRNANKLYEIVCFNNSDYAGDPVSRRSVSCFVLYVLGVLVSWQSKAQKNVMLSNSEVEWVASSEAVKKVVGKHEIFC